MKFLALFAQLQFLYVRIIVWLLCCSCATEKSFGVASLISTHHRFKPLCMFCTYNVYDVLNQSITSIHQQSPLTTRFLPNVNSFPYKHIKTNKSDMLNSTDLFLKRKKNARNDILFNMLCYEICISFMSVKIKKILIL